MDQVSRFLEASNFESIEFVSKKWEKFGTSWIFKGKRDGTAYLQLLYSGDHFDSDNGKFLVAEKLQQNAWNKANRTKLREEKRVSLRLNHQDIEASAVPAPSEPGTPTKESQTEDAMDESERATRATITSGGVREKPQPLQAKVPNDGGWDCLFRSISHSIEHTDNKEYHHRQVRAAAVTSDVMLTNIRCFGIMKTRWNRCRSFGFVG